MPLLLAGDVGGTKTELGVFDAAGVRLAPVHRARFATGDYADLGAIVDAFLEGRSDQIAAACLGVAGPVRDGTSQLTNVPWRVSGAELGERFGIPHVAVMNDVAAAACSIPVLGADQLQVLHPGNGEAHGNRALIAVGTGLGEALLPDIDGGPHPVASEAGHADFPARTPRELALVADLTAERGRVSCEQILSGPGLVTLSRFTHRESSCRSVPETIPNAEKPAAITASAAAGRCVACTEALDMFVNALGAEAGNLGLRGVATGGVYIGGGIPRHVLRSLERPDFLEAFWSKPPMEALLRSMPVGVITDPQAALVGAAVAARHLL